MLFDALCVAENRIVPEYYSVYERPMPFEACVFGEAADLPLMMMIMLIRYGS